MSGQLLHNLLLFGRILRGLGLEVNPGRMVDVVQALEHVQLGQRSDFYHALRSLLAQRREHLPLFDQAFELFWVKPAEGALLDMGALLRPRRTKPVFVPAPAAEPPPDDNADEAPPDPQAPPVVEVTQTFSTQELLPDDKVMRPEDHVGGDLLKEDIASALDMLSPWEASILRMRFGFLDGEIHPLSDLARKFGLSREGMRQVANRAMEKIRQSRHADGLREYMSN